MTLSRDNNITTGKIYREVIEKEASRFYSRDIGINRGYSEKVPTLEKLCKLFHTSLAPYRTGSSAWPRSRWTRRTRSWMCIPLSWGGPWVISSLRHLWRPCGSFSSANFALIRVLLVPDMHGEQKTKPTQMTVHSLHGLPGLLPDLVHRVCLHIYVCVNNDPTY